MGKLIESYVTVAMLALVLVLVGCVATRGRPAGDGAPREPDPPRSVVYEVPEDSTPEVPLIPVSDRPDSVEAQHPSVAPVRGWVTQVHAETDSVGDPSPHKGIDIATDQGTPFCATASGRIAFVGEHGDYGNTITIDHGSDITTLYAHASKIRVRLDQQVRRGEVIGEVGSSGNATGPHLHYEVRLKGEDQNPSRYILGPPDLDLQERIWRANCPTNVGEDAAGSARSDS